MGPGRTVVSASILDADFRDLRAVVALLEAARVDRLHLDVMDAHFVPNLTFGPMLVRAFRDLTALPLDTHLMIAKPYRYAERFVEAGSDSVTFHFEALGAERTKRRTLDTIRDAGRSPGLAVSPRTPVSAVEPYVDLLDLIMIMTVEPGFGGQRFMAERAGKIGEACALLSGRPGASVHVDGGVSSATAAICGRYGAGVLVIGSALFKPGADAAAEIDRAKRLADEAWREAPEGPCAS